MAEWEAQSDLKIFGANYSDQPAEVTSNGDLVRESSRNPLKKSGLGIYPDPMYKWVISAS